MATLKHIIDQIADSLNRPFDGVLKARLKELVVQEFMMYVSRTISKGGIDKEFVYSYLITELEEITTVNGKTLERPYLQTVNKIPRPLRYSGDVPFVYVGMVEGDIPFSFRNIHSRQYTSLLPNIGQAPSYDFHDDRIRIWNAPVLVLDPDADPPTTEELTQILVQEVPFDIRVSPTPDTLGEWVFDEDRECPITQDLVQMIKLSLLKGELSVTDSKDKIEATHLDNN